MGPAEDDDDDDDDDEFEPLFTYRRVCRPPSDAEESDDEVSKVFTKPGQKRAHTGFLKSINSNADTPKTILIEDDNDDDWLISPPKVSKLSSSRATLEDPTVVAIRREREELISLTARSEASLKKLEDDIRKQRSTSLINSVAEKAESQRREKVTISVQNKDGVCKAYKIYMDDKFEKLFSIYAESVSAKRDSLVFSFDGDQIDGQKTPSDLGIEADDIIEVNMRS